MATNLVGLTKSYFTPELVQKISAQVGVSSPTTQKAIEVAIPTLLAGLTNLTASGTGTTSLTNLLTQGNYS
ncbi:MAG TPA: DUF937 domain-containing protein, partial [Candidatus Saccharimonadales bacterium]|nr:DUF937 domain-containing protein [Candidatus Saccharimonadales bacterium]